MSKNQLLEKYLPYVKLNGGLRTNLPVVFGSSVTTGGLTTGTLGTLASAATVTFTPTTRITTHSPTQASTETINFGTPNLAGTEIFLQIVANSTSQVITFGTNTKNTGTLTTGTTAGKVFLIAFVSDGTNWNEVARTTAM